MRNSQNETNRNIKLLWFTWRHFLCFFLGIIIGFCFSAFIPNLKKCRKGNNKVYSNVCNDYQGIDVSNHQGRIDWSLVSADKNIQFVYIKATEGATHVDQSYSYNILESRKNGLKAGSYHYLRSTSNILSQFKNFTSIAKVEEQDLIPMVDIEEKVDRDSIKLFCDLIERHYGKKPVIYGTNRSYNSFCAPDFNHYILMIGRYGENRPAITGDGHYNIWQFSERGSIPGINKPVDLDRFHPDFQIASLCLH